MSSKEESINTIRCAREISVDRKQARSLSPSMTPCICGRRNAAISIGGPFTGRHPYYLKRHFKNVQSALLWHKLRLVHVVHLHFCSSSISALSSSDSVPESWSSSVWKDRRWNCIYKKVTQYQLLSRINHESNTAACNNKAENEETPQRVHPE